MTLAGQPQYLTARENNVWLLGKDHWKSDLGAGGDFFTFGNFFSHVRCLCNIFFGVKSSTQLLFFAGGSREFDCLILI